jgi:SecY interacting protein Syd
VTVKEAMSLYFARLSASQPILRTCDIEGAKPILFVGDEDEEGYVRWVPMEKAEMADFSDIERRLGTTLHPSLVGYYNAYWFMEMGGRLGPHGITLDPVVPGRELSDFEEKLFGGQYGHYRTTGYLAEHGGVLSHVPIGLHHPSDLMLVVENTMGAVAIEDHERGTFEPIAVDLADLIARLEV